MIMQITPTDPRSKKEKILMDMNVDSRFINGSNDVEQGLYVQNYWEKGFIEEQSAKSWAFEAHKI